MTDEIECVGFRGSRRGHNYDTDGHMKKQYSSSPIVSIAEGAPNILVTMRFGALKEGG